MTDKPSRETIPTDLLLFLSSLGMMPFNQVKKYALWGALAALLVWLCYQRLTRSLWLDETLTAWVVSGSLSEVLERTSQYHPQSPFFFFLTWLGKFFLGDNELGIRSASLVFALLSLPCFYFLLRELDLAEISLPGSVLLAPIMLRAGIAFNARPYSLGIFFSLLSTIVLIKWLKSGEKRLALAYIVLFALTIYAHYLFGALGMLHLLLASLPYYRNRDFKLVVRDLAIIWVISALLLVPVAKQLLLMKSRAGTYSFIGLPSFTELLKSIILPYGPLLAILWSLSVLRPAFPQNKESIKHLSIGLGWLLVAPVILFALSHLTGISVFIPRYFVWHIPAFALLAAYFISRLSPDKRSLASIFSLVYLLYLGDSQSPWLFENWRDATEATVEESKKVTDRPILFYSGLTETRSTTWLNDSKAENYLKSPLSSYGFTQQTVLLPYDIQAPELQEYLSAEITALPNSNKMLLVVREMPRKPQEDLPETSTSNIFVGYLRSINFRRTKTRDFGDIKLISLSRDDGESSQNLKR